MAASKRQPGRPPLSEGPGTRERILASARKLFAKHGYEKTTFKDIAHDAGVTRTAVNYHYTSKQALYEALFDSVREMVVTAGLKGAADRATLPERLAAFLEVASQVDSRDRSYAQFISASLIDASRHEELGDRANSQLDDVRQFIGRSLEEAVASGEIRPDADLAAITEMLTAAMWGMALYAGFVGSHEQLEGAVEQFTKLLDGTLW